MFSLFLNCVYLFVSLPRRTFVRGSRAPLGSPAPNPDPFSPAVGETAPIRPQLASSVKSLVGGAFKAVESVESEGGRSEKR